MAEQDETQKGLLVAGESFSRGFSTKGMMYRAASYSTVNGKSM